MNITVSTKDGTRENMTFNSVVWEWPERRGLEHLRVFTSPEGTKAEGVVVADAEGGIVRFRYSISQHIPRISRYFVCLPSRVLSLSLSPEGTWRVDDKARADLEDCIALDILDAAYPKTLVAQSLGIAENQTKALRVLCVDNRNLTVQAAEQEWTRLPTPDDGFRRYRCTSPNGEIIFQMTDDFLIEFAPQRWRIRSHPPREIRSLSALDVSETEM